MQKLLFRHDADALGQYFLVEGFRMPLDAQTAIAPLMHDQMLKKLVRWDGAWPGDPMRTKNRQAKIKSRQCVIHGLVQAFL